jgi:hypothetical protein
MSTVRARTSWVAALWLVCQLGALGAPLASHLSAAGANADTCTCPGQSGDDGACPMHHGPASNRDDSTGCAFRSACAPPDVALLSLSGGLGILTNSVGPEVRPAVTTVEIVAGAPVEVLHLLDSPPPRA